MSEDLGKVRLHTNLRFIREIAAGAMGTVFEAEDSGAEGFTKRVAVKRLHPELSKKRPFVEMFIQEAKLVADLVHENIVQIYQLISAGGKHYILMEYVHGMPLSHMCRVLNATGQRVPNNLAIFIAARIARGLSYAHSRRDNEGRPLQVVHRDICPHNVLINTEGQPKITDFGIALAANRATTLDDGAVCGKGPYMSPEQAAVREVDFRTDIFALGTVLFQLLSGTPVRQATTMTQAIAMARATGIDWDALPADLPDDQMAILRRALAADRNDRFESADVFGKALEYEIYKGGYGPTIQTLEEYLRAEFPYLYTNERPISERLGEIERTLITT